MTTKASKRQAQRTNKRVPRDLLGDIDALRAASVLSQKFARSKS